MARAKTAPAAAPVGSFHRIQQEAAARRRQPYQLTEDIVIPALTVAQADAFRKAPSDDERLRILLGDQHEAVMGLLADEPMDVLYAFQEDLFAHLYGQGATGVPGGSQGS